MALSQANLPLQVTTPFSDVLVAQSFSASEGISTPFVFSLDLVCQNAALDFSQVLGKGITVSLAMAQEGPRYFHGLCTRFVQGDTEQGITRYRAELRPWLWMLTLATDCKVFQNQSVPDIVTAVFSGLGFTCTNSLTGTYTALPYCVQYRETSFDFVSRLLEGAGISYFFKHASGSHTLVLADDASAFSTCAGLSTANYGGGTPEDPDEDTVGSCDWQQQVLPGKLSLNDYSFTTPSTSLLATANAASGTIPVYDYPGGFLTQSDGETVAGLRLAADETWASVLRGRSWCRAFVPGCTFTLAGHDRSTLNQAYLITSVSHTAGQEGYVNHFEAIPTTATYRPPLNTAAPVIAGAQTAVVVGPSGNEIYTDQYGRIKVQFHWDRVGTSDENSSCWIRVAQGWAGQGWGTIFLPRVGMEVVVTFLEGNPDAPLVTGCVYNAQQTVPYALPANQTRTTLRTSSSKGGSGNNEIRFEDNAGSEELFIQAQKDMNLTVLNNCTWTITQAHSRTVSQGSDTVTVSQGDRSVTVSQGAESLTVTQGNRTVSVAQGNETHSVGGTRSLSVTGDETHDNSGAFTHTAGNGYTLNVTGNLSIQASGSITLEAGSGVTISAGTSLSVSSGGTASLDATGSMAVSGSVVQLNC